MKLSVLATVAAALVASTDAFSLSALLNRPTVEDAARIARTLINRESLANLNTIYQEGDDAGLPVSFVEYYADCDNDGSLTFLAVNMGSAFRNIEQGSPVTLTIRTGDHGFNEEVDRQYPGSRPNSVAGSPRINLRGHFKDIDFEGDAEAYAKVEKCFVNRHKDAVWWLPGNPIHKTRFAKFEVEDIYFLGGFGDTGYIGKIPVELYKNAESLDSFDDEGNSYSISRTGDDDIKDLAFQAYLLKHNVLDLTNGFYNQIDSKSKVISELLKSEQQQQEEVVLDLSEENEASSILDLFKSKFNKRDLEEQIDAAHFKLNDLSKEQLKELLTELESLKSKIVDYSSDLISKYELPSDEELSQGSNEEETEDVAPRYPPIIPSRNKEHGQKFKEIPEHEGVDPHHKFTKLMSQYNKGPHHVNVHEFSKQQEGHGARFQEIPEHEGVDPHHGNSRTGIAPSSRRRQHGQSFQEVPEHENVDPHHAANPHRQHGAKFQEIPEHEGVDPHHAANPHRQHGQRFQEIQEHENVDPHHSVNPHHGNTEESFFEKIMNYFGVKLHGEKSYHHGSKYHKSHHSGKFHQESSSVPGHFAVVKELTGFEVSLKNPHHSNGKSTLRLTSDSQTYRIVEASERAKPGFYSSHDLYKAHHQTDEVPEWLVEEMVVVVPTSVSEYRLEQEQVPEPKLVNQAAH